MLVKLFYKLVMSLVHFSLNHHFLLVLLWRKFACLSQLKNQRFICKLVKRPCDERATAPVTVCNFFFGCVADRHHVAFWEPMEANVLCET